MQQTTAAGLLILAIMSAFWAYTIIDTLIRDFAANVTYIDLGAIFVLGVAAGASIGLAVAVRSRGVRTR